MTSTAESGRPEQDGLLQTPPLSLYVHFPWCVRKCPYCDFNSHEVRGSVPADEYINALLEDLDRDLPLAAGRRVTSVYFGGGTPSLMPARSIARLIEEFRARLDLATTAEITLETNPGTLEHDSFVAYRDAGINRVSLGAQSFDDDLLQAIGRIHGRAEIAAALEQLQIAGIRNFNIDLMFGLPGQSVEQAVADLESALAARPAHISHYQLTLEPNTAFASDPPELPAEDDCWAMQDAAREMLERAGFGQYEVSGWSVPGRQCGHNLNYWRYGDFLGIGAGAHGKVTDAAAGRITRLAKPRHPRAYLEDSAPAETRSVEPPDRVFEFFLNRLRLREGIRPEAFSAATGLPWEAVRDRVGEAVEKGLLARRDGRYVHTRLGWRFVNDLQAIFLP